jgi:SsrA-binding protein
MLLVKNRKALYNYEVVEKYLAGISLYGYEVKAIREKRANLDGAYIRIVEDEAYIANMMIGNYSKQSQQVADIDKKRLRKLLLTSGEIQKIKRHLHEKGKTAVPLALLLRKNMIKLELATVKGRKKHEKKQLVKDRQIKRDLEIKTKELMGM